MDETIEVFIGAEAIPRQPTGMYFISLRAAYVDLNSNRTGIVSWMLTIGVKQATGSLIPVLAVRYRNYQLQVAIEVMGYDIHPRAFDI